MLQRYSYSNNYHIKFSSDGWSEHLCCGTVNTFDAREISLRAWVEHTKTCEKLSLLRVFLILGTVSSGASLLLSNCVEYFWQEILQNS